MAGAQIRKGVHVDLREDDFAFSSSKGRGASAGSESSKESGNLGFARASLNVHFICQGSSFPTRIFFF